MPEQEKRHCLICSETEGRMTRGLCVTHYTQFQNQMAVRDAEGRKRLEKAAIAQGMLLPSRQGKRDRGPNKFETLAAAIDELSTVDAPAISEPPPAEKPRPRKKSAHA